MAKNHNKPNHKPLELWLKQNIEQRRRPCEVESIPEDKGSLFPLRTKPTAINNFKIKYVSAT